MHEENFPHFLTKADTSLEKLYNETAPISLNRKNSAHQIHANKKAGQIYEQMGVDKEVFVPRPMTARQKSAHLFSKIHKPIIDYPTTQPPSGASTLPKFATVVDPTRFCFSSKYYRKDSAKDVKIRIINLPSTAKN